MKMSDKKDIKKPFYVTRFLRLGELYYMYILIVRWLFCVDF